jgi:Xaa-Pro dipeptidase
MDSPEYLPSRERAAELIYKRKLLQEVLVGQHLDALLLSRHENIAWATAGLVDMRIGLPRETGCGSLLFTRDGASYYLSTNNEAARLADEEFAQLDFRPLIQPWFALDPAASIRNVSNGIRVRADDPTSGFPFISLKSLRIALLDSEIERYCWLGKTVAQCVTDTLVALKPGMTEVAMQAALAERLLSHEILPSVLLTAVDDRIRKYRHAVPRAGILHRLGMLNVCARRWGLSVSITRYVHFGVMPNELDEKFAAVARVNATILHATRPQVSSAELFSVAQAAYSSEGYANEEQMHHQGGATGYWEREWLARPGGDERILEQQAIAWNPSIQGVKVEDTVLLRNGKLETLTITPQLPLVPTRVGPETYFSAGVVLA